jgi:hypothetical protein
VYMRVQSDIHTLAAKSHPSLPILWLLNPV